MFLYFPVRLASHTCHSCFPRDSAPFQESRRVVFADDAKDIIRQLLNPDQDKRLGCTDLPGVQGLYAHPFFEVRHSLGACLCVFCVCVFVFSCV